MKNISNLVNNMDLTKQGGHSLQNQVPPIVKTIVDSLFDQLAFVFPAWKYTWDTEEKIKGAKKEWVKAFFENEINTKEQIAHGLKRARKEDSDFIPSCGKFISWCKPSPESLGWPSSSAALKECIKHRANQKMFVPQNIYIRPMIVELCKRVDWWMMDHTSNQADRKKADEHFLTEYTNLLESGYQEPKESQSERLETKEIVKARMSPGQKEDARQRGIEAMREVKAKLKSSK